MSWDNVISGDGLAIAATGIFIVFTGLALISLLIAAMPRLFNAVGIARTKLSHPRIQASNEGSMGREPMVWADEELLAAIGAVIEMELERERMQDDQRITISRDEAQKNWAIVGTMRTLSTRM